ncbi:hypothetical protein [Reyranella sp.]|uniref:hypothetical protein n=1 Tax=Reyranella sp. TaxID=1929291 RepID=UPI004036FBE7
MTLSFALVAQLAHRGAAQRAGSCQDSAASRAKSARRIGHDAVVQDRRSLLRDPAEVAAGAVETPVDHRFEQGLLAGPVGLEV